MTDSSLLDEIDFDNETDADEMTMLGQQLWPDDGLKRDGQKLYAETESQ